MQLWHNERISVPAVGLQSGVATGESWAAMATKPYGSKASCFKVFGPKCQRPHYFGLLGYFEP